MGNGWALYSDPERTPHPMKGPSFDPLYGFPNGRKERVMIATEEEMESAKLPLADRDFCAHLLLKYRACRADKAPWLWQCGHEKHEYLQCEYEDLLQKLWDPNMVTSYAQLVGGCVFESYPVTGVTRAEVKYAELFRFPATSLTVFHPFFNICCLEAKGCKAANL
ncbi:hypothetical protein Cfor_00648 [Coptotermes formosanus]|uniref:NADH dehydrogenase [ubiquinone] 1 beta subcomplex subunit 7 n=1 Tax=Coptotermes formosanus TaxID=36987 RepID=A0A6L2P8H4_COPFO|nr:hypothetical protein Cfor_00648 [Coptotermes formosanus]